jgi:hypothetical protein
MSAKRPENPAFGPQDTGHRAQGTDTAALRGRGPAGTPVGTGQPELHLLIAEWQAGRHSPAKVRLGRMPENATEDMCRVAEDMELLMGLRLAAGEDRALPYASKFAAKRLGWGSNYKRARRAIHRLCDAGVIRNVGSMEPRRGKRDGTRMYGSPLLADRTSAVEGEAVDVEAVGAFEPEPEVGDKGVVVGAVLAEGLDPSVATGNRAGGGVGHEMDATPARGGSE